MMTTEEFKSYRDETLANKAPHLITDLSELRSVTDNIYAVGNTEFKASNKVVKELDKIINLSGAKIIESASGSEGLKNARNYFSVATSMEKEQKVMLVANPDDKEVVDVVALKREYIPAESFFDFLEFFAHTQDYSISHITRSESVVGGATAMLVPNRPTYTKVMEGEEFLDNGIFFKWTPNQINAGNYILRLVCMNGAMELSPNNLLTINSMSQDNISKLMSAVSNEELMRQGFERYTRRIEERKLITASMSEMAIARNLLDQNRVAPEMADEIVGYAEMSEHYRVKGIEIKGKEHLAKGNISLWDLYNNLTHFATHNKIWAADDSRRTNIISSSNRLLTKRADIIPYLEIAQ